MKEENWKKDIITPRVAAAGIVEAEHPGDQQRRFMMGNCVGARKHRARLTVIRLAIGEKQRVFRRILLADPAALAHKTVCQDGPLGDARTPRDDEIFRNYLSAHGSNALGGTQYGTVPANPPR